MNRAYERNQEKWGSYKAGRVDLSSQIDDVARGADDAHANMVHYFERASEAYEHGDKADVPSYAADGREYRDRRDSYNAEKHRLIELAKSMSPPKSDFSDYKNRYDSLMNSHKNLQSRYNEIKSEHENVKNRFEQVKEKFNQARAELERAIEQERTKWSEVSCRECGTNIRVNVEWTHPPRYCTSCREKFRQRRIAIAQKAGKRLGEDDVKVRFNPETGKNDVCFGGLGKADGLGHGHAIVDETGNVPLPP